MCGVVDGGITAGLWGYEAGQSGVGDIFGWFVDHGVPPAYHDAAAARGVVGARATHRAGRRAGGRRARPGRARLAQRQPLGAGRPRAVRAWSSARPWPPGPRTSTGRCSRPPPSAPGRIIEAFDDAGVPVTELVVAGGLLKNALLMQIYADVTGLPLSTIGSDAGAGAGLGDPRRGRRRRLPRRPRRRRGDGHGRTAASTSPIPAQRRGLRRALRRVPAPARLLRPRRQRRHAPAARPAAARCARRHGRSRHVTRDRRRRHAPSRSCARRSRDLHAELTRYGLVVWTAGNVSARVPGARPAGDQAVRGRPTTS